MKTARLYARTRRVRKTRWTSVSGTVWDHFDDILVLASQTLPRKITNKLEPWDLAQLIPYQDEYLSGFRAESYQVDLAAGFEQARSVMEQHIRQHARRDIGGDEQRIHTIRTQHDRGDLQAHPSAHLDQRLSLSEPDLPVFGQWTHR